MRGSLKHTTPGDEGGAGANSVGSGAECMRGLGAGSPSKMKISNGQSGFLLRCFKCVPGDSLT